MSHHSSQITSATEQPTRASMPRVLYGSSSLGNLYQALPLDVKLEIVSSWFEATSGQVVIDTAGKYGAGLALESLGKCLRALNVDPARVSIGNKLGWYRTPLEADEPTFEPGVWKDLQNDAVQRISGDGILACWNQGLELLGEPYAPNMLSVHDPDEYLASATDNTDYGRRHADLTEAYAALRELCNSMPGRTLGVGVKDWRIAKEISEAVELDWVMLANCITAYTHPQDALEFIASLVDRGVTVINSGVFNAGFLVGGQYFDYRLPSPKEDKQVFEWRDKFSSLCEECDVQRAHACIQFGLSPPGVESIALNTNRPERVKENWRFAETEIPMEFWRKAKERAIIDSEYPYLGV